MKCTKPTFSKTPAHYWRSSSNREYFFESIRARLKIKDLSDWYKVTPFQITQYGGGTLFRELGGSMYNALRTIYPQYKWLPWKFANTPKYFWQQESNRKEFFDHLQTEFNICNADDWYKVKTDDVHAQGGGTMMTIYYGNSMYKALSAIYPEHNWLPWRFQHGRVPTGYWYHFPNQKKFFEWAATQLGVHNLSQWYSVTASDIQQLGGGTLLQRYNNNLYAALSQIFPEKQYHHHWQAWKFSQVPHGFWNSVPNIHQFIRDCTDKLHITQLDDWYRVSMQQVRALGASYLIHHYGGLPRLLEMVYPDHPWDFSNTSLKKAAQRWLRVTTQSIFGLSSEDIIEDFPHPLLTGLRLDVWIPSLTLALEYQGQQHFQDLKTFNSQRQYQEKDALKRQLCNVHNIELIAIPYWWDRAETSLLATILHHQPQLIKHISLSYLPTSHTDVFVQTHRIPDTPPAPSNLKQLMFAKEVGLPTKDQYKGWWMVAQPSGVRLYWDASLKKFFLKSGKQVSKDSLLHLQNSMPPFNVDGFLSTSTLNATKPPPVFHIMDIADPTLSIEARQEKIKKFLAQPIAHINAIPYQTCQGVAHLLENLKMLTDSDGIVLKAPGSIYKSGISDYCVFVKLYEESAVSMVRIHPPTGHLLCQQDNGQHVFVRCDGDTIANPPSPGTKLIVQHTGTYRYSGRLKTPSFKCFATQ